MFFRFFTPLHAEAWGSSCTPPTPALVRGAPHPSPPAGHPRPPPHPSTLGWPPHIHPGPLGAAGGLQEAGGLRGQSMEALQAGGGGPGFPQTGGAARFGVFSFSPPRATSPPAVPQLGSGLALARGGFFGVFFFFFSLPACNFPSHAPALSRARSLHAPPLLQSHPPHLSSAAGRGGGRETERGGERPLLQIPAR